MSKIPSEPIDISAIEVEKTVKKYDLVVIDCWSSRCPPCVMLTPILKKLAKKHTGKVVFAKVCLDNMENRTIAEKYNISGIPTMLIFKQGKLKNKIVGLRNEEDLEKELELK